MTGSRITLKGLKVVVLVFCVQRAHAQHQPHEQHASAQTAAALAHEGQRDAGQGHYMQVAHYDQ